MSDSILSHKMWVMLKFIKIRVLMIARLGTNLEIRKVLDYGLGCCQRDVNVLNGKKPVSEDLGPVCPIRMLKDPAKKEAVHCASGERGESAGLVSAGELGGRPGESSFSSATSLTLIDSISAIRPSMTFTVGSGRS